MSMLNNIFAIHIYSSNTCIIQQLCLLFYPDTLLCLWSNTDTQTNRYISTLHSFPSYIFNFKSSVYHPNFRCLYRSDSSMSFDFNSTSCVTDIKAGTG